MICEPGHVTGVEKYVQMHLLFEMLRKVSEKHGICGYGAGVNGVKAAGNWCRRQGLLDPGRPTKRLWKKPPLLLGTN